MWGQKYKKFLSFCTYKEKSSSNHLKLSLMTCLQNRNTTDFHSAAKIGCITIYLPP